MTDTDGHLPTDELTRLLAEALEGLALDVYAHTDPRITSARQCSTDTLTVEIVSWPPDGGAVRRVEHREIRVSSVLIPDEAPAPVEPDPTDLTEAAEREPAVA